MKLLFVGFGTVGQGLAELLLKKEKYLSEKLGITFTVVGIADKIMGSLHNPKGLDLKKALTEATANKSLSGYKGDAYTEDTLSLLKDVDADVMFEATYTDIKTGEPATSHIRTALEQGIHVATTNKGPVALHYKELADLAAKKNVRFLFEGTVMSGTPVLNLLRETLVGTDITEIKSILNGTTNYILTRMEEGLSYKDALKKAQELGYAEAVPDTDVLGWDALAKVTILAKVLFGGKRNPFDYPCEGITKITPALVLDAKNRGKRFKLIGKVWREGSDVKASVDPEEVDMTHPLAGVMGATNALTIATDSLGEVTIVGPGAGRTETGYSLLIDLITISKTL